MQPSTRPSAPSHADYLARGYLPELDGLRAVSIVLVITVHMKDRVWGWLGGNLGVTVFFVLSGYLITLLALREERESGRLNIPAFFVRRAFRLFPLYYLVLALYCGLIFGLGWAPEKREMLARALPFYLAYFQEYPFIMGLGGQFLNIPFYQSWSLGIEEKFYLVWPFVAFGVLRASGPRRRVATVALAVAMMTSPLWAGVTVGKFLYPYSHILLGCATALLLDDPRWFARLSVLGRRGAIWPTLAATLALLFAAAHAQGAWYKPVHSLFAASSAALLIALVLEQGALARALGRPLPALIGRLSYGMYLIHLFAINAAEKVARPGTGNPLVSLAAVVLAFVLSAVAAYALAVLVERPGIAIGRRISRGLRQGDPAPTGRLLARDGVRA